ncbi:MAG: glycoside hydrolase family 15 protein [Thermoleophilia bacterium]|nr:glycoside hydrolase family 15 protein [Thermoleophilia bacterium]
MALRIEDYALVGDLHTGALVGRNGSIDWLCLPRFDSGACFAALLGNEDNGCWIIAPAGGLKRVTRRYRGPTLVLETEFETEDGVVRVIDFMPPREERPDLVRVVEGVRGRVPMRMRIALRFDYGSIVPWVRRAGRALLAVGGPDAVRFDPRVEVEAEAFTHVAEFAVAEGDRLPFVLTWYPSHLEPPEPVDPLPALDDTESWWREWADGCTYSGGWRDHVRRSLITLKALTYRPTGGIVASVTSSLPEQLGGVRNWDYRYCWLRDATFTLWALLLAGYLDEARAWRDWLLRAIAGAGRDMRILYGPAGERRLPELELPWLSGYEGSRPVRIGNAAAGQSQHDVYGEIMDAMHQAREGGLEPDATAWAMQRELMEYLEGSWCEPDEGIWEVRGPRRHFTHSKVMAWVAADRAVKAVERGGLEGPLDRWKRLRADIHRQVCREGYDPDRGAFTQYYGSKSLDASLLMMPLVGFLPATDPRVRSTVEAIDRELCVEGFVHRYLSGSECVDGLPEGEGAFLACTFWLADNLALMGRRREALEHFERLLDIRNDVGLLSEEYDVRERRLVGNYPQAFSHVSLINTARNLSRAGGPAERRGGL